MTTTVGVYVVRMPLVSVDGNFTWPGLALRASTMSAAGQGVFATEDLPVGTMIPILGSLVSDRLGSERSSHVWCHRKPMRGTVSQLVVDGYPQILPYRGIGNFGSSIAMMVNEASVVEQNCVFLLDHVCVAKPVPRGTELTVYYGGLYDTLRQRNEYAVVDRPNYSTFPALMALKPTHKNDRLRAMWRHQTREWIEQIERQKTHYVQTLLGSQSDAVLVHTLSTLYGFGVSMYNQNPWELIAGLEDRVPWSYPLTVQYLRATEQTMRRVRCGIFRHRAKCMKDTSLAYVLQHLGVYETLVVGAIAAELSVCLRARRGLPTSLALLAPLMYTTVETPELGMIRAFMMENTIPLTSTFVRSLESSLWAAHTIAVEISLVEGCLRFQDPASLARYTQDPAVFWHYVHAFMY